MADRFCVVRPKGMIPNTFEIYVDTDTFGHSTHAWSSTALLAEGQARSKSLGCDEKNLPVATMVA